MYDHGLWPSLAERLGRSFGRVLYYRDYKDVAPRLNRYLVGTGLENVTRVKSFFRSLDEADLVVFADVNDGDLQEYVRSSGKPVFGCIGADELEIYRWESRQVFKKLGLAVPNGVLINGLSALRDHLKEVEDKYIKISVFRGDWETFHHENYRLSETTLDEFARRVGPAAEDVEFIVDDPIEDAVEIGYDGFFSNGVFPAVCMYGYEIKDGAYCGYVCENDALPDPLLQVNAVLAPLLSKYGYCGFLSTEIRLQKDGAPILMELTCRAPSPPGELALEMWENLPEMLASATAGEMVEPKPKDNYGAEIMLYSDWSDEHWTALDIPEKVAPFVKLSFSAEVAGYPQIVPQGIGWGKAGGVIGFGKTVEDACRDCANRVPLIRGKGIEGDASALDKAEEVIEQGRKYGIDF